MERLRTGAIDLGLLARPFDVQSLSVPDLVVEPFVLVAPTGHPLSIPETIRLQEITGASLILMEDGHCLRDAEYPPGRGVRSAVVQTFRRGDERLAAEMVCCFRPI